MAAKSTLGDPSCLDVVLGVKRNRARSDARVIAREVGRE